MGQCDAILQQGVFDTIVVNTERNVSDNLLEWLKSVDFTTLKDKIDSGLKIGFPIIVNAVPVPIDIGGEFNRDKFEEWKRAVDEGRARSFTENESLQIIQSSASAVIVDAWLQCIINNSQGTGIKGSLLSDNDAQTILFRAQFIPNSPEDADRIPRVEQFIVTGSTSVQGIKVGDEIPFSGVVATISRDGRSEITINLLTDKGSFVTTVPAIPEPPQPPPPPPPVVNVAGTYRSQENNRYLFEQDGTSVTVTEIQPDDRVIANGAGQITNRTVNLTYQSLISDETGTARITLSQDGRRLTGIYTRADTGETFALDWVRL